MVYVLEADQGVKIGLTQAGMLWPRIEDIRRASGCHVELVRAYPVKTRQYASRIERCAHWKLGAFRTYGEWFHCHPFEATETVAGILRNGFPAAYFEVIPRDNPPCVNPAHLFLGTPSDNSRDMTAKGRNVATRDPQRQYANLANARHGGEHNGRAKITRANAEEIRRLYAEGGLTHRSLGARFGITASTVGRIVKGDLWPTR